MISVILPIYNKHEMSRDCIQTIMETTTDYEIIVIDNGSEPPFKPPFSGFNSVIVIRNEKNEGFPVAINQGIRAATGDIIVLLNDDVVCAPGWAQNLSKWLEDFDIVGPTTNYCAGLQMVTLPLYENIDEFNKEAGYIAEKNMGVAMEVKFLIGFCMMFKRELYDEIGPFDESLWPCSGEEIDFCYQARGAGYKIGIALDVYVHHYGSQTFEMMQDAGQLNYGEICARNDAVLAERWGANFWQQQEVRYDRQNERD